MKTENVHVAFFSATFTTRKVVMRIASRLGGNIISQDITEGPANGEQSTCGENDVMVMGAPVYAGRIPEMARGRLAAIKGNGTPAIAVCVYGNRDYDDALLELCDLLTENGFHVVAAAAFIGCHSIFPMVAAGRPDETDLVRADNFGDECARLIGSTGDFSTLEPLPVKGNRPYKKPGGVPLHPAGDKKECVRCDRCVTQCPAHAISADKPYKTDTGLCISCGRCIAVCPTHTRKYSGLLYNMVKGKFVKMCAERREAETLIAQGR